MIWTSYTASGGSIEATSPTGETAVYHITLPDVLAFITGCPTVPPIGFQPEPSINFQNESPFPRANTCIKDNILRVHGLETAPVTIKMVETIIVMPCCVGKSRQPNSTIPFCYVQTKLQSFSNWGNHNIKLESVCPRYKMPEKHNGYANSVPLFTSKWPLEKPIPQLQSSFE